MRRRVSHKNRIGDIVFVPLFAVLMAVCSWISLPTVIPVTMQTFGVFLTLNFLGAKRGILSICLYLTLGLMGLPVYANHTAGVGILLGANGGYMIGWLLAGLVMLLLEKLLGRQRWAQGISMLVGLGACYASGTLWFMIVYARSTGPIGLWTALLWCVVPFVLPDLLKLGLALWVSRRLEKIARLS